MLLRFLSHVRSLLAHAGPEVLHLVRDLIARVSDGSLSLADAEALLADLAKVAEAAKGEGK